MNKKSSGRNWFLFLAIIFLIMLALMSESEDVKKTSPEIATTNAWTLTGFENLAVEYEGELYDLGSFRNTTTGETLEGRCITMDHTDPEVGDTFEMVGGQLAPLKDGSQYFEPMFELVEPTEMLVPTSTPIPTQIPTATMVPTSTPFPNLKARAIWYGNMALAWLIIIALFTVLIGGWILIRRKFG